MPRPLGELIVTLENLRREGAPSNSHRESLMPQDWMNRLSMDMAARVEYITLMSLLRMWASGRYMADGWDLVWQEWYEWQNARWIRRCFCRNKITGLYWEGEG